MTPENLMRLRALTVEVLEAQQMLERGLIDLNEYNRQNEKFREKVLQEEPAVQDAIALGSEALFLNMMKHYASMSDPEFQTVLLSVKPLKVDNPAQSQIDDLDFVISILGSRVRREIKTLKAAFEHLSPQDKQDNQAVTRVYRKMGRQLNI